MSDGNCFLTDPTSRPVSKNPRSKSFVTRRLVIRSGLAGPDQMMEGHVEEWLLFSSSVDVTGAPPTSKAPLWNCRRINTLKCFFLKAILTQWRRAPSLGTRRLEHLLKPAPARHCLLAKPVSSCFSRRTLAEGKLQHDSARLWDSPTPSFTPNSLPVATSHHHVPHQARGSDATVWRSPIDAAAGQAGSWEAKE